MRWLELSFATTHEAAELLTDYLTSLGADGVQIQDAADIRAILNDPDSLAYADDTFLEQLDPVVRIKAYFAWFAEGVRCNRDPVEASWSLYASMEKHHVPLADLEKQISDKLVQFGVYLPIGAGYQGWQEVREEDWAENWKKYYHTLHVTPRIVINPSWLPYQPAAGELVITLDPGSAFGTGSHETTTLCVALLDQLLLPGRHVLDLGCGSGILAIVAARLKAVTVEAIDLDASAVMVAKDNCRRNGVAVHVHAGTLQQAQRPAYDLIVANIIADVIVGILPSIPDKLFPEGLFIASGIIAGKLDQVTAAAAACGMEIIDSQERNDWYALVMRRSHVI